MKTNTRIDKRLQTLHERGEKAFIAYITAGDPNLKATEDMVLRLEEAGADIIELGIPFSDPLADGRVNQEAATRALAAGTNFKGILRCVEKIRKKSEIPLLFFSYLNPLISRGFEKTANMAAQAGIDGFLVLDLPVEEDASVANTLNGLGLNNICLVTPTSTRARIKRIVQRASGFVYCVSREGVTGVQKQLSNTAIDLVRRTKKLTALPVALGFGISTPAQARTAAEQADAVIVGSAIVDRFAKAPHTAAGRASAAAWTKKLINAVKRV